MSQTQTIPLYTFSLLFSSILQYNQNRIYEAKNIELQLRSLGEPIGRKLYESISHRTKKTRELNILNVLKLIQNQVWPQIFARKAMDVRKAGNPPNAYLLYDEGPIEERFVSIPRDVGNFHSSYFTAGILQGCLKSASIETQVTPYKTEDKSYWVFIIQLQEGQDQEG